MVELTIDVCTTLCGAKGYAKTIELSCVCVPCTGQVGQNAQHTAPVQYQTPKACSFSLPYAATSSSTSILLKACKHKHDNEEPKKRCKFAQSIVAACGLAATTCLSHVLLHTTCIWIEACMQNEATTLTTGGGEVVLLVDLSHPNILGLGTLMPHIAHSLSSTQLAHCLHIYPHQLHLHPDVSHGAWRGGGEPPGGPHRPLFGGNKGGRRVQCFCW